MVVCLLLFQLTGEEPKRMRYPVVDLLENGQAAQSESKKTCKESESEACSRMSFLVVV